jgi:N-acetylglucosaminyl-diphospho-decaprenol L-rhamnosyltransferase
VSDRGATIDVAIVNWNTAQAALAAAEAFRDSEGIAATVTIADNASSDEQRDLLRKGCPPEVTLALSDRNLGYGVAANRVLRHGSGELVCVSNADVLPSPEALAALAETAFSEAKAGMIGPTFGSDTDRYHASLPNAVTMLVRIFVGSFARGAVPNPQPGEVEEIGQPSGACFLVKRQTWEQVGGFDEGFFLWYEDVDLAKRLHDGGFRNVVVGSARVGHVGAESFAQIDRRRQQAIRLASVEHYIRQHHRAFIPLAIPLLRLARRLRAGGARAMPSTPLEAPSKNPR